MNKNKTARQFIYEIAAVSIVAIMLGGIIGSLTSVPVTNALLSATAGSATEESFDRGGPANGEQPGQTPSDDEDQNDQSSSDVTAKGAPHMQDYIDSVTSAANFTVTLKLMLIGLALIAVSGGAAMAGVMKYDPLSILTTRD
jgi:putative ABC transport system permease protein